MCPKKKGRDRKLKIMLKVRIDKKEEIIYLYQIWISENFLLSNAHSHHIVAR